MALSLTPVIAVTIITTALSSSEKL